MNGKLTERKCGKISMLRLETDDKSVYVGEVKAEYAAEIIKTVNDMSGIQNTPREMIQKIVTQEKIIKAMRDEIDKLRGREDE